MDMSANRVRSIELSGGLYSEYGAIDQNATKRQRFDFERESNNLTPIPNQSNFIENPEIMLAGTLSDPYGGMRWNNNNGLGSYDMADIGGGFYGPGSTSY
jgi:hypothetical protein